MTEICDSCDLPFDVCLCGHSIENLKSEILRFKKELRKRGITIH